MQPRQHWRVHGTQFIFFKPFHDQPVFYNRDQLVSGPPLNTLGINYHGDLTLTAYGCVFTGLENGRYQTYLRTLGAAADKAFRTMPELAIQLACDILTDISQEAGTITHQLKPADGSDGESYRQAFITAWRILDPDLPADKTLFPCEPKLKYINLVKELGMVPVIVRSDSIRTILSDAGAFKNIEAHALDLLIRTPRSAQVIPGFNRFQLAISRLVPSVQPSSIVYGTIDTQTPRLCGMLQAKHSLWQSRTNVLCIQEVDVFAGWDLVWSMQSRAGPRIHETKRKNPPNQLYGERICGPWLE